MPAKYTVKTGSQLLIIEPEYIEWSSTQEFYPFVFDSVGDWTVTTTVTPPEGFVADQPSLTAEVNTDLKALQFIITDVGSKWVETGVTYDLQHKGKKEKIYAGLCCYEKKCSAAGGHCPLEKGAMPFYGVTMSYCNSRCKLVKPGDTSVPRS